MKQWTWPQHQDASGHLFSWPHADKSRWYLTRWMRSPESAVGVSTCSSERDSNTRMCLVTFSQPHTYKSALHRLDYLVYISTSLYTRKSDLLQEVQNILLHKKYKRCSAQEIQDTQRYTAVIVKIIQGNKRWKVKSGELYQHTMRTLTMLPDQHQIRNLLLALPLWGWRHGCWWQGVLTILGFWGARWRMSES